MYFGALVPLAHHSPFPSHVLGPVKRVHPSIADWLAGDARRGDLERCEPASEVEYPPPSFAVPETPPHFARCAGQHLPEQFVATIRDGRVAFPSFDVISPDDGLIADLVYGVATDGAERARSRNTLRMPPLRRRQGSHVLIATNRAGNYYHWLNDCLTRLRWLDSAAPEQRWIVPARMSRFQRESLALLGIGDHELAPFGHEYWSVSELVVPALASMPQHSNPAACRWLRGRYADAVPPRAGSPRRVFISRAAATKRRLLNEEEIVSYLRDRGFEVRQTELLSFREQVELACSAEILVAPHGAGLANATFMPEGATVIELLPARRTKPCFYSLAAAVGLRYGCVTDAAEGAAPAATFASEADFRIPLERVAAAVEWAVAGA